MNTHAPIPSQIQTSQESQIERFSIKFTEGVLAWKEAGLVIVEILREDPNAMEAICAAGPHFTPSIVRMFLRIGQNQLHPMVAAMNTPGAKKLGSLPIELQEQYLDEGVELALPGGDKMLVAVKTLTTAQADQVFGPDGVRSQDEQRAYFESKLAKTKFPALSAFGPYTIKGSKVHIRKDCSFTLEEILDIAMRLKK